MIPTEEHKALWRDLLDMLHSTTSPADYPDRVLSAFDEFCQFLAAAEARGAAAQRERELVVREVPTCIITGRIAGDSDACGDCDPCSAAHKIPAAVKRLLVEKDEWRQKYDDAVASADARD